MANAVQCADMAGVAAALIELQAAGSIRRHCTQTGNTAHGVIDREVATMKEQANEYFFLVAARTLLPLLAL